MEYSSPANLVDPPDTEDLLRWNCNADSSWGISHGGDRRSIWISPPLEYTGSDTIDKGEQFVFNRFFAGRLGDKNYFEVCQKFVHLSDLHFVPERNAYCRLDDHGDIDEVVRIVTFSEQGRRLRWHCDYCSTKSARRIYGASECRNGTHF